MLCSLCSRSTKRSSETVTDLCNKMANQLGDIKRRDHDLQSDFKKELLCMQNQLLSQNQIHSAQIQKITASLFLFFKNFV